jgi:hypothetical protein
LSLLALTVELSESLRPSIDQRGRPEDITDTDTIVQNFQALVVRYPNKSMVASLRLELIHKSVRDVQPRGLGKTFRMAI